MTFSVALFVSSDAGDPLVEAIVYSLSAWVISGREGHRACFLLCELQASSRSVFVCTFLCVWSQQHGLGKRLKPFAHPPPLPCLEAL